jgi:AraC-like DNA-binding protein
MAHADLFNIERWLEAARKTSYNAARLARELKISPRQLQRYTQKIFGSSPQHWLGRQRIIDAVQWLKEYHSVKDVAYKLGFKQPCHFSREFKRHHGITPREFLQLSDSQSFQNLERPL